MKHHVYNTWGIRSIAPLFVISTLDGDEWSASHPGRFTSGDRIPWTYRIESLVGPERQTRPLVREGAPPEIRQQLSENNLRTESNIWSQVPEWTRYLNILTDWLTVSCNVTSTSTWSGLCGDERNVWRWPYRPKHVVWNSDNLPLQ
jgi:hypothetical protein